MADSDIIISLRLVIPFISMATSPNTLLFFPLLVVNQNKIQKTNTCKYICKEMTFICFNFSAKSLLVRLELDLVESLESSLLVDLHLLK